MGTRYVVEVIYHNTLKVAQYGSCDGYLSYAGVALVRSLRQIINENNYEKLKNAVDQAVFLPDSFFNQIKSDNDQYMCFYELFSQGCEILDTFMEIDERYHRRLFLKNNDEYTIYAEYVYLIDLDKDELVVFKGDNKKPLKEDDHFYYLTDFAIADSKYGFYPSKEVFSVKIKDAIAVEDDNLENYLQDLWDKAFSEE